MADLAPTQTTNLDPDRFAALAWERAADQLRHGALGRHPAFLGSTRPDGRPHAARVGALWLDGDLYFTSAATSRKARNLAANPASTIAVSLDGMDLMLEGVAERVRDPVVLAQVAARYADNGWPVTVAGEMVSAPYHAASAGLGPWQLYRFTIQTVFGEATAEPYGATRWRFARA